MSKGLQKELPEAHLTWKVVDFYLDIFQYWKVLRKDHRSRKVLAICLTQAIKFSEFTL